MHGARTWQPCALEPPALQAGSSRGNAKNSARKNGRQLLTAWIALYRSSKKKDARKRHKKQALSEPKNHRRNRQFPDDFSDFPPESSIY
jgi:hypothetical protein